MGGRQLVGVRRCCAHLGCSEGGTADPVLRSGPLLGDGEEGEEGRGGEGKGG